MKVHRFIINFELKPGILKLGDIELLNQFRNVLKLKIGERIILGDGEGIEGGAEIKEYGKDFVKVEVFDVGINKNEPEKHAVLYCAILKKENFEMVVQKATEIGVKEIYPLITERTVKLDIRKDRLEKIIKEAAEQSGRGMVAVLHEPVDFDDAVKGADSKGLNLFFDISGKDMPRGLSSSSLLLTIWIGPEGGWTGKELKTAETAKFSLIRLGKTMLRAETSAIIGTFLGIHNL